MKIFFIVFFATIAAIVTVTLATYIYNDVRSMFLAQDQARAIISNASTWCTPGLDDDTADYLTTLWQSRLDGLDLGDDRYKFDELFQNRLEELGCGITVRHRVKPTR